MILVPVKDLATAKQRLAAILNQSDRTALAQAMLLDVLETLDGWKERPHVGVVSSDPFALELATRFEFEVIQDTMNHSETAAIEMATALCESRGIDNTLVIPGDIPLVQREELEHILEAAPVEGAVLVPAADGRGTNAAFRRPAGLFPLRFGTDSFKPHLAAARATETECVVLSLPGVGLDVDTPFDLAQLAAAAGETRAQRLVRGWNLTDLPVAANE